MSVWTIDPFGMTAIQWADAMALNIEQFGNLGRLENEEQWRAWAEQLLNLPGISGSIVPDPYAFESWQVWAAELNTGLSTVM